VTIRAGTAGDVPTVLALMDEAVEWLVGRGQTAQWGTEPISGRGSFVSQLERWVATGGLRVAESDEGETLGALVVGRHQPYVPPVKEPELYVILLVTSRRHAGEGVGSRLVERAIAEARAEGVHLLRVDCWAGAPRLVQWYEEQGFVPTDGFAVGDWQGQLLELRIAS
jgi:GNAT superfamily N-acetyltransferase